MHKAGNGESDLDMCSQDEVGSGFFQRHGMASSGGWMQ